ncbi:MAG TPA: hypothetical protein VGQ47_03780 [Candidatus Limnocylindrales bacterium]|nr:hypothetical protein [Candidatus Limnocylindrales bacterium]
MDELRRIVVSERQRGLRAEAAEDRLGRLTNDAGTGAMVTETSHFGAAVGPAPEARLERALFGRETRAIGSNCCVPFAERAGQL